jgi:hypothetical protein
MAMEIDSLWTSSPMESIGFIGVFDFSVYVF